MNGANNGTGGGGGGGGGGGAGFVVTVSGNNSGLITGGIGGNGGAPGGGGATGGGGGGAGGAGVFINANGVVYTNDGTINGGTGGNGGSGANASGGNAGDGGVGVALENIATLNNTGSITGGTGGNGGISAGGNNANGGNGAPGIYVSAGIGNIVNSGTIIGGTGGPAGVGGAGGITGSGGVGMYVEVGTISSLANAASGMIRGTGADGLQNYGAIVDLTNAGTIKSYGQGGRYGLANSGTISNLNNSGLIQGLNSGLVNNLGATITVLTNAVGGNIGGGGTGITNAGSIGALTNSGGISSAFSTALYNTGSIDVLTNIGQITAPFGNMISNSGTISTLNNLNGGITLTYSGALPQNYNIIISSASSFGKLSGGTGSTVFGISSLSGTGKGVLGSYASIITGISNAQLGVTGISKTGTSNGYGYVLSEATPTSNIWDLLITSAPTTLVLGPSTANTQQSLVNTSTVLQGTYALQNAVLSNSLSYDCTEFGVNNICISAGGRNTAVATTNGLNNSSALLIAAYRPHPNYRIGAYADQNLSVNNGSSTVTLGNNTPLVGIFGVWSERLDGAGTEVKVAAAYGQKNTSINRSVVGTGATASEAGSGSSSLNSQGAQVTAKYGFKVIDNVVVSPYIGMRYTQNNMGGYIESSSSSVTAPLGYSALNTNATTALAGLGASYKGVTQTTLLASAGVEGNTSTTGGTYSASSSSIPGLTPINFNANPVKTRPTASLGAYYDIEKNQRIGVTGIYRQESYQAVSTTTVLATYTIGL